MASGERFSGYPAKFGYATGQVMNLTHLESESIQANNTITPMRPPGMIDPDTHVLPRAKPMINMRTPDLLTILSNLSFTKGKCFDEVSQWYAQERDDCGEFLAANVATHSMVQSDKGFMFIDTITAEQESDQPAMVALIFVPLVPTSSSAAPLLKFGARAIAAASPAFVSAYFLGPVYKDGTEIPGVTRVSLTPRINFQGAPHSPGAFDNLGSIITREAEFTFSAAKTDEFDATQITGDPVGSTYKFYLQRADPTNNLGDGRIAKANNSHIMIGCSAGYVEERTRNHEGPGDKTSEIVVRPAGEPVFAINVPIP